MSAFCFEEKKLLASLWAMFKLSHKIMYVRRIVHKQFKIAYPLLLAICSNHFKFIFVGTLMNYVTVIDI